VLRVAVQSLRECPGWRVEREEIERIYGVFAKWLENGVIESPAVEQRVGGRMVVMKYEGL